MTNFHANGMRDWSLISALVLVWYLGKLISP